MLFQFSQGWYLAIGEKFFVHGGCLGTLGLSSLQVGNDCLGRWGFCGPDEGRSCPRTQLCFPGSPVHHPPALPSVPWREQFNVVPHPSFGRQCPHSVIPPFSLSFLICKLEVIIRASKCRCENKAPGPGRHLLFSVNVLFLSLSTPLPHIWPSGLIVFCFNELIFVTV